MFAERRMSALEQDSGRYDIRSERSQGGRSERSGGNMPSPCSCVLFRAVMILLLDRTRFILFSRNLLK